MGGTGQARVGGQRLSLLPLESRAPKLLTVRDKGEGRDREWQGLGLACPKSLTIFYFKKILSGFPGQVAQLVGASSHAPKGYRFNPQSQHIREATNQCFAPSLPLSLDQINKHVLR